jgi:MoxR-like ATPase
MSTQISAHITEVYEKIKDNIGKVIVGKSDTIDMLIVSMLCGGHVLLEDVPGTGKTVLIKSLAASVSCEYKRIQFTPDLLPSDITGVNFFNMKKSEFEFVPGPIFANIVLADEINRATPKTQSGLLECMEEIQATIDGKTFKLAQPFMVIATQNPVESMGTFPLPEAQLDRFLMKGKMDYPNHSEGVDILARFDKASPLETLQPVVTADELVKAIAELLSIGKISIKIHFSKQQSNILKIFQFQSTTLFSDLSSVTTYAFVIFTQFIFRNSTTFHLCHTSYVMKEKGITTFIHTLKFNVI